MIIRTLLRVGKITNQLQAAFSKDPFDRFNKKKASQSKKPQVDKERLELYQKAKNSKNNAVKTMRTKMQAQRKQEQERKQKEKQKQQQIQEEKDEEKERSQNLEEQEQSQKTGFQRFNKMKKEQTSDQGDKNIFRRGSHHLLNNKQIKITTDKKGQISQESQKQSKKKQQDFPKINLDFENENEKSENQSRRGRKINKASFKYKEYAKQMSYQRPNTDEQEKQKSEQELGQKDEENKNQEQATANMKKMLDEETNKIFQQQQRWQRFEQQIQNYKKNYMQEKPRYQRLHLYKGQQSNKKQESFSKGFQKIDHRKNMIRIAIAGVGLFLLASSDIMTWDSGKQVDPQDIFTALNENRIYQTWFQHTSVTGRNEDHTPGKNVQKKVYIREIDGVICYCQSNQEFQRIWTEMVVQHNVMIDRKTPQIYQNQQGVTLNKSQMPPSKVIISPVREASKNSVVSDIRHYLSLILLYYFFKSLSTAFRSRGGRTGGRGGNNPAELFGDKKSHRFKETIKITFQDVVGMQKAKQQIVQFIDFLKNPQRYNKLGARIPRGALLTGPPGTGKTMIAKACAGESKVPFFTISGSQFIEMYVGVGAQRVRNLFKQAKESAPSIIFIDQIDAVGKKRSGMGGGGGNDQRDTTLNQLLVEMDGFDTNTNVIIFAATNQKEVLDPALTRPGRFDRLIQVDLPDLEGRREIFQVHLKPLAMQAGTDLKKYAKRLATLTPGFSGADIKNVCNEAAIIAARNHKEFVSVIDFQMATERIIGGVQKKSQLITPQTKKTVAYHECGHGVVSWFIQHANPLLKLTIIPRSKGALGFAQYLPNQQQMYTRKKMIDEICVILGGRVTQQIFFGKISTGASDDLDKAYRLAKTLVTQYGFGEKLGWLQYNQTQYAKQYSKETQDKIDAQILQIMRVCSQRTRQIVRQKRQLIQRLAEKLLELQTIDQNVIQTILGQRPFKMSKQHEEYIRQKKLISEQVKTEAKSAESRAQDLL